MRLKDKAANFFEGKSIWLKQFSLYSVISGFAYITFCAVFLSLEQYQNSTIYFNVAFAYLSSWVVAFCGSRFIVFKGAKLKQEIFRFLILAAFNLLFGLFLAKLSKTLAVPNWIVLGSPMFSLMINFMVSKKAIWNEQS